MVYVAGFFFRTDFNKIHHGSTPLRTFRSLANMCTFAQLALQYMLCTCVPHVSPCSSGSLWSGTEQARRLVDHGQQKRVKARWALERLNWFSILVVMQSPLDLCKTVRDGLFRERARDRALISMRGTSRRSRISLTSVRAIGVIAAPEAGWTSTTARSPCAIPPRPLA